MNKAGTGGEHSGTGKSDTGVTPTTRDRIREDEHASFEGEEGQASLWGRAMSLFTTIWRGDSREETASPHGITINPLRESEEGKMDGTAYLSNQDGRRAKGPPSGQSVLLPPPGSAGSQRATSDECKSAATTRALAASFEENAQEESPSDVVLSRRKSSPSSNASERVPGVSSPVLQETAAHASGTGTKARAENPLSALRTFHAEEAPGRRTRKRSFKGTMLDLEQAREEKAKLPRHSEPPSATHPPTGLKDAPATQMRSRSVIGCQWDRDEGADRKTIESPPITADAFDARADKDAQQALQTSKTGGLGGPVLATPNKVESKLLIPKNPDATKDESTSSPLSGQRDPPFRSSDSQKQVDQPEADPTRTSEAKEVLADTDSKCSSLNVTVSTREQLNRPRKNPPMQELAVTCSSKRDNARAPAGTSESIRQSAESVQSPNASASEVMVTGLEGNRREKTPASAKSKAKSKSSQLKPENSRSMAQAQTTTKKPSIKRGAKNSLISTAALEKDGAEEDSKQRAPSCQTKKKTRDEEAKYDDLDLIERFKRRPRRAAPQAYFFDMIPDTVFDESSEEEVEIEEQKVSSKAASPLSKSTRRSSTSSSRQQSPSKNASVSCKSARKSSSSSEHQQPSKALSVSVKSTKKPSSSSSQQLAPKAAPTPSKSAKNLSSQPAAKPAKAANLTSLPAKSKKKETKARPSSSNAEVDAPVSSSRSARMESRRAHLSKVCLGNDILRSSSKLHKPKVPETVISVPESESEPELDPPKKKRRNQERLKVPPPAKTHKASTSLSIVKGKNVEAKSCAVFPASDSPVAESSTPRPGAATAISSSVNDRVPGQTTSPGDSPSVDDSSPLVKAVVVSTPQSRMAQPRESDTPVDYQKREVHSSSLQNDNANAAPLSPEPPRVPDSPAVRPASRETNVRPQIPMPRTNKHVSRPSDTRTASAGSESTPEGVYAAREVMGSYIMDAVVAVASALKDGPWPSPCRSFLPEAIAARESNPHQHLDSHEEHMTIVGASLVQFARDVILPSFLVAQNSSAVNFQRVIVGTMVLLREVLVMNSGSIFRVQPEVFDNVVNGRGENAGLRQTNSLFVTKILATSIILYALESLEDEIMPSDSSDDGESTGPLERAFLRAAAAYDGSDDEFLQFAARPLGETDVPILPSGDELETKERRAWLLTLNVQRSRHPLLQRVLCPGDGQGLPRLLPAEPTVAHVTVLEEKRS